MRINNRRKLLERQRAAAPPKPLPAESSPAPTSKPELPVTPSPAPPQPLPTSPPQNLQRPPSASILGSPLHPSLPAKPGTVPPPQASSPAPPPKVELPVPTIQQPAPAPPSAPATVPVSSPAPAPTVQPATQPTDPQIVAWEDVSIQFHQLTMVRAQVSNAFTGKTSPFMACSSCSPRKALGALWQDRHRGHSASGRGDRERS